MKALVVALSSSFRQLQKVFLSLKRARKCKSIANMSLAIIGRALTIGRFTTEKKTWTMVHNQFKKKKKVVEFLLSHSWRIMPK